MSEQTKITFKNPPVQEVVCGVQFEELTDFRIGHFGLLWHHYADKFPRTEDRPPLLFAQNQNLLTPRVWFISEDETQVIQVQRDRFLLNWRRTSENDTYPRFEKVYKDFLEHLQTFQKFLAPIGGVKALGYELAYINNIELKDGVFPDILWRKANSKYLCTPKTINSSWDFGLPFSDSNLQINIQSARIDGMNEAVQLSLAVRGVESFDNQDQWFENAHQTIVQSFIELTGEDVQKKMWGRY